MTFGWEQASSLVTNEVAREMIKVFSMFGHSNVDTAAIYTGGKCEGILANVLPVDYPLSPPLLIGTKAHPSLSSGFDNAGLSDQFANSLSETKQSSFEEYFLHQPDSKQDVLPALKFVNDLIHKGQVKHLGLSNYAAVECERIFALCEEHQLHKPTRYQGLYNPLNRMVEEELLPLLKANGCSFVAYNPLAAGLLTGRHHRGGEVTEGERNGYDEMATYDLSSKPTQTHPHNSFRSAQAGSRTTPTTFLVFTPKLTSKRWNRSKKRVLRTEISASSMRHIGG